MVILITARYPGANSGWESVQESGVLAPYRRVLSRPGALAFSTAGVLARLPMSMVTISIVLMISTVYDTYGLAGRVAAAYALAQAICAPQIAKLVDRFGQAKVMRKSLAIAMVGLTAITIVGSVRADELWLYLAAVLSGATVGSMGAMVRARWNRVVDSPRDLHTAYSLESALDELVFVIGPVLATFLATSISPTAGLVTAIVAAGAGGFWFLSQRATEPPPSGRPPHGEHRSVMRSAPMVVIALVFVAMGIIFGASDVATVAFSEAHGAKAWAGVMLAVMAAGSLLSGLLYGAREWVSPLWKRFVGGVILLALGVSLFVWVDSLFVLAPVMFVTGFAIAPTIITGNALVQALVPRSRLTEGLTWVGTAIGLGFAFGTSLSGQAIDSFGPRGGYFVVMGAGITAALVALAASATMRAAEQSRPLPAPEDDRL
ncbi:MFS transporter [Occultella aeris]|uniref:Major Facilitator Superfamily protein n=1 Tax=Occultella aeris TaxID=2761496 RepID=A0A7M4DKM5_9MICO|nr:Major Facilitator Superfamily protein [Occultella aeris]